MKTSHRCRHTSLAPHPQPVKTGDFYTPPPDADPWVPDLSRKDATYVKKLMRGALAAHGFRVVSTRQGVLWDNRGASYGLGNISVQLAQQPRDHWPQLVDSYVSTLLSFGTPDLPTSLEGISDKIMLKLDPAADLPVRPEYAPEVLPGVLAIFGVYYGSHMVKLLGDDTIDTLGGWEKLQQLALENLRHQPSPHYRSVTINPDRDDTTVHLYDAGNLTGASRFLLLDEMLGELGYERPELGTLIAVPYRELLVAHVVTGPGAIVALAGMARLAHEEYHTHPGPISPDVFYRSADGYVQRAARLDPYDAALDLEVCGPFAHVLESLSDLADPDAA